MTTSTMPARTEPVAVRVTSDTLTVDLADGRAITVPTEWFPRLAHGSPAEWANYQLTYGGIHWPDLNEDVSVDGLLRGQRSGESIHSLSRWFDLRRQGRRETILTLPLPSEPVYDSSVSIPAGPGPRQAGLAE